MGCTTKQGQEDRMLHKTPKLFLPSFTPLYTNAPGELLLLLLLQKLRLRRCFTEVAGALCTR